MQHNGSTLPRDISTMVDATNTHALRLYAEGAADPLGRALAACPVSKEDPTLVPLDLFSVILASLLIGVGMAVSIWLRLRLEVKLLVAAVRCVWGWRCTTVCVRLCSECINVGTHVFNMHELKAKNPHTHYYTLPHLGVSCSSPFLAGSFCPSSSTTRGTSLLPMPRSCCW